MRKPILGITMGDAAGIGPEITLKVLQNDQVYESADPLVLGDARVLQTARDLIGSDQEMHIISSVEDRSCRPGLVDVLDYQNIDVSRLVYGQVDPMNGEAAVHYTMEAARMALEGRIDAVVSAPMNKESMRAAGYHYEGATQIFGEMAKADNYGMILILGTMRLMLLTTHMSLREAIDRIKKPLIVQKLRLCHQALRLLGMERPRIAVAALNPHAGEGGLFGDEEIKEIEPAIREAVREGIQALGPFPADTIFVRGRKGEFDITLALYHDQGLMTVKLLGFGNVVTYLAGLPFIRVSVGHGTAFDIAGQNRADHKNLLEATITAARYAQERLKSIS